MITSYFLQQNGFTKTESHQVMQKLTQLKCVANKVRIRRNYVKNGVVCDLMYHGDSFPCLEAFVALKAYYDNIPCNANKSLWKKTLQFVEGLK